MKRILSIDGGGIRGLMVAAFLERLELHTKRRTANMFDMIAGTSTGGLVALFLTVPKANSRHSPAHSAIMLRKLYEDHAKTIFPPNVLRPARQLFLPKHSAQGLTHLVRDRLRDAKMSELVTEVVVPAFDQTNQEDAVFKRHAARETLDFYARDVALATSAAPTYFRSHKAASVENVGPVAYLDGGVWANNPALCAHSEALRLWPGEQIEILSLGTGRKRSSKPLGPTNGGILQWAASLADLFMDSGERGIDYQINNYCRALGHHYTRIQIDLPESWSMDTTEPEALQWLTAAGYKLAEDYVRTTPQT